MTPDIALLSTLRLMAESKIHRQWTTIDIMQWIVPAFLNHQLVLLVSDEGPIAYASWASVNDEAHHALKANARALETEEWNSGENIWVIDFIAPYGHVKPLVKTLKALAVQQDWVGRKFHWTRRHIDKPLM